MYYHSWLLNLRALRTWTLVLHLWLSTPVLIVKTQQKSLQMRMLVKFCRNVRIMHALVHFKVILNNKNELNSTFNVLSNEHKAKFISLLKLQTCDLSSMTFRTNHIISWILWNNYVTSNKHLLKYLLLNKGKLDVFPEYRTFIDIFLTNACNFKEFWQKCGNAKNSSIQWTFPFYCFLKNV